MKIQTYKCVKCKDEIYSRAHYDFNSCECEHISVDGGHLDLETFIFTPERLIGGAISAQTRVVDVDVTEKQLYDDWNESKNEYGRIQNG